MPDDVGQLGLSHLVELAARLKADEGRPRAALHRRDREVGRGLAGLRGSPARQLAAWLAAVREPGVPGDPGERLGERVAAGVRLVTLLLVLAGLVVGWGVAAVLFYYDGSTPVNVVNVLAVFVGVQLVLLLPLAVMLLPGNVPGVRVVQETVSLLSPGRLWRAAAALLPGEARDRLGEVLGHGAAHEQVYGRVEKWAIVRWSQVFVVALNIGAITRFLQLIVFTDVAFAWSTTLRVSNETVYGIARAMALPWAWAWEDAAPTAELVETTRFFRPQTIDAPLDFGGWWPFVLMCMVVYGLLPRVAALVVAQWRLRRAVGWAMVHTPGAAGVLERLNGEYVETRGEGVASTQALLEDSAKPQAVGEAPRGVRVVVNWAGVPVGDEALREALGANGAAVVHCGGARGLEEDARTIAGLPKLPGGDGAVVVATKSWEPPMLEIQDFLGDLRKALGPGVVIAVTPVGLDEAKRVVRPDAVHLAQWQRRVKAVGDAWTSVAEPAGLEERGDG